MDGRLRRAIGPAVLGACLLASGTAQALRIDGLDPLQPRSASISDAAAYGGRLELRLDSDGTLAVGGWPAFLPQRFGPQRIAASRRPHPTGPSDRLDFSRPGENRPWLIVASGARRGATLVGAWQLQSNGRLWSVTDGTTEKALGIDPEQALPVPVTVDGRRWCLYLLESRLPRQRPGLAAEDEPQAAWAGWRLDQGQTRCPAAR